MESSVYYTPGVDLKWHRGYAPPSNPPEICVGQFLMHGEKAKVMKALIDQRVSHFLTFSNLDHSMWKGRGQAEWGMEEKLLLQTEFLDPPLIRA